MAVPTKTIDGSVIIPNGVGWAGGIIRIKLSAPATVVDPAGPTTQVANDRIFAVIASDGTVDFKITPNDILTPADTVYIAEYVSPNGFIFTSLWRINTADADPLNIGNIELVLSVPGGFIAGTFGGLSDVDLVGVLDGDLVQFDSASGNWIRTTPGSGSDGDAIHDNVDNEIALIAAKTALANADVMILEDSAASLAKKKVTIQDMLKAPKYTNAGKPPAIAANDGDVFRVKDIGVATRWEVIYETATADVYAYWVFIQPFP